MAGAYIQNLGNRRWKGLGCGYYLVDVAGHKSRKNG